MTRDEITRELLGQVLRRLRGHRPQREIAERMTALERRIDPASKAKRASQISDWEHGKAFPELANLLSFLAACSPDGNTVDLCLLQHDLDSRLDNEGSVRDELMTEYATTGTGAVQQAVDLLSRRLSLQDETQRTEVTTIKAKMQAIEEKLDHLLTRIGDDDEATG